MNKKGYIDPGTGGMVVGSTWPIILAIIGGIGGFFVKVFYRPIKNKILKFKNR